MSPIRPLLLAFGLVACMLCRPAQAAAVVGNVEEIAGGATVTHAGEKTALPLKQGDSILENDAILTSEISRLKILFRDKTELVIAHKGSLVIDKYIFDENNPAASKAEYSVLGLAFYYVGGLIDKVASPDVKINLDLGSIGIRGTKIMRAMKNGQCWIYLEDGKITVSNKGGETTLNPGEGTIMTAKTEAPGKAAPWDATKTGWMKDEIFGQGR